MVKEIGKVSYVSPVVSGVSQKSGQPWANCTLVIEVQGFNGMFRKVAMKVQSDDINEVQALPIGSLVEVQYKVVAREFNGKWYNDVNLHTINRYTPQGQQTAAPQYQQQGAAPARPQTTPYIPPQPAGPAFGTQGVDPDLGF